MSKSRWLAVTMVCGVVFLGAALKALDAAFWPIVLMVVTGVVGFLGAWKAGLSRVKELETTKG